MPYEYLEDVAIADIAFRAWAPDLAGVFLAAADATLNVMIEDLDTIRLVEARPVSLRNDTLDMLLFGLLQEIIYYKDAELLLLRLREARIEQKDGIWTLDGVARGERLDLERHAQRVDVKAVTLYRFALEQTEHGWEARVILDV